MEIILLKDVAKVGKKLDIVHVSEGYAINFLIPKGLARAATASARKAVETQKATIGAQHRAHDEALERDIMALNGAKITLTEKVNAKGHLFGSLHPERILDEIRAQLGISIPKECLMVKEPIKTAGDNEVSLQSGKAQATLIVSIQAPAKK
ncbi:50S ribosomal protein L9 [Candidatus Campbellbacteria bacterium]|nr:MAG: 50S ribosomal protein L9 [Candidatus Campbellbacteria bacterium]